MNPADPTDRDFEELAAIIGRELRQLPSPRAPHSLLARVMTAIPARQPRPRSWFTWPLAWRALSVGALALMVGGLTLWWPTVQTTVTTTVGQVTRAVTTDVAARAPGLAAAAGVASSLWRGLVHPVVGYLFLLVVVMCAACAAFGAVLGRVALGGASQS